MRSSGSCRRCSNAARLPAAIVAVSLASCSGFSPATRTLPERGAIVMDAVRADPKVEGRDLGVIAGEWRAAAPGNERRLAISACNYLDLVASYAAGKPVRTVEALCVALRKGDKGSPYCSAALQRFCLPRSAVAAGVGAGGRIELGDQAGSAHDFYSLACCSGRDCGMALPGDVTWTPAGYLVRSTGETIPLDDPRIQRRGW